MRRMIFHRGASNFSIGVDVSDEGDVSVAVAATHPRDNFCRSTSNKILNTRLNNPVAYENNPSTKRAHIIGRLSPTAESLEKSVFGPIRDSVRGLRDRRNVSSVIPKMVKAYSEANAIPAEPAEDKQSVSPEDYDDCCGASCPTFRQYTDVTG